MSEDPFSDPIPSVKRTDCRREPHWRAQLRCGVCGWTRAESNPSNDFACPDCGNVREFTGIRIGGRPGALNRSPKFRDKASGPRRR